MPRAEPNASRPFLHGRSFILLAVVLLLAMDNACPAATCYEFVPHGTLVKHM